MLDVRKVRKHPQKEKGKKLACERLWTDNNRYATLTCKRNKYWDTWSEIYELSVVKDSEEHENDNNRRERCTLNTEQTSHKNLKSFQPLIFFGLGGFFIHVGLPVVCVLVFEMCVYVFFVFIFHDRFRCVCVLFLLFCLY